MSVLINLLPDTRQAKLRAKRRRQLITAVAVGLWIVCGGALLLLTLYTASQKLLINQASAQISVKTKQLQETQGLLEALNAQQHLASLPGLYGQRVYLTKFFTAYSESNPTDVTLSSLTIDSSNSLTINGNGKTYAAVAKLAKALEAAHVGIGTDASADNQPYFTSVTIQSVSRSNGAVGFSMNAVLQPGVTSGSN